MALADVCAGYFLNLDRLPERRHRFEAQLRALGLEGVYHRFPAIDGATLTATRSGLKPGEIGVFHSHAAALKQAPNGAHIHILEDDAVISTVMEQAIVKGIADGQFEGFDIIFTDTIIRLDLLTIHKLNAAYNEIAAGRGAAEMPTTRLIDLAGFGLAGMTSYLVPPSGVAKLTGALSAELAIGPNRPIDIYIRHLVDQRALRAACIFPFLTTVDFSQSTQSTINQRNSDDSDWIVALLRYAFYVSCNLGGEAGEALDRIIDSLEPEASPERLDFLARISRFLLSERAKLA